MPITGRTGEVRVIGVIPLRFLGCSVHAANYVAQCVFFYTGSGFLSTEYLTRLKPSIRRTNTGISSFELSVSMPGRLTFLILCAIAVQCHEHDTIPVPLTSEDLKAVNQGVLHQDKWSSVYSLLPRLIGNGF